MSKAQMIAYIIVSGITPAFVLLNSLQGTTVFASPIAVKPLQSISWLEELTAVEFGHFALKPENLVMRPQAHIMEQDGQFSLEFYHPFSQAAQAPDLMLVLATTAIPNTATPQPDFMVSDRHYIVGELQSTAGKQSYSIPASVNISQYLSVLIWCPELDAIMGYAPLLFEV
ncbi:MAG: DM13 domain-containing protein [Cyanobacteria bacterium J06639_14]